MEKIYTAIMIMSLFIGCSNNDYVYNNSTINQTQVLTQNQIPSNWIEQKLKHENGDIKLKGYIDNDKKRQGKWTCWYKNATKEFDGYYNQDVISGEWRGWYSNGQQSWRAEYNNEGKQTGKYYVWHEDGKIALEGHYENGKEIGKWTCYNEDGSINWKTDDFKNKKPDQPFITKYKLGIMSINIERLDSSEKSDAIKKDINWVKPKTEEEFILAANELRRKHILQFSSEFIDDIVSDSWLLHLKGLPLQHIDFMGCEITDAGLSYLKDMPLNYLKLSSSKLTAKGISHLKNTPIKELTLYACLNFQNNGLLIIKDMSLDVLNLFGCQVITDSGLPNLKGTSLKKLRIKLCYNISDKYNRYYETPEEIIKMIEEVSQEIEQKKKAGIPIDEELYDY